MTVAHYRWLVTDLDGTLVGRDLRIVPRSAEALARFRAAGGEAIIATGRNEEAAGRYRDELGLETPMILYNGARVVAEDDSELAGWRSIGEEWPRLRAEVLKGCGPGSVPSPSPAGRPGSSPMPGAGRVRRTRPDRAARR